MLRRFAEDKHMIVTDIDVEERSLMADSYNVQTVPTTVVLLNGEEQFRLIGFKNEPELEEAFAPYL